MASPSRSRTTSTWRALPTTAACPAFAHDLQADATVVARLKAAGALVIGKANLDQFATGLNGSRSPLGAPRSVFDAAHVSGGSSSGSARGGGGGDLRLFPGHGHGRVGARSRRLRQHRGVKPTPGLVPGTGVVLACRSVNVGRSLPHGGRRDRGAPDHAGLRLRRSLFPHRPAGRPASGPARGRAGRTPSGKTAGSAATPASPT